MLSDCGSIYLSKFSGMNDGDEEYYHMCENNRTFILSLCHSEANDIPLFYLYSGIDGKGCRLEFTKNKLLQILKGDIVPVNKKIEC